MTKQDKKFKELWSYFPEIRCINLKSRKDRYKKSKKVFDKYNIPVDYFFAKKHPKGGLYGCFDSHIKVITEAYNKGLDRVLIFEDDIFPSNSLTTELLKKAIRFMKKEKWDLFYFGALPCIGQYLSQRTKYNNIYQLHGMCCHAYVVNRSAMRRLIGLKYTGTPLDYHYIKYFKKSFALYPTLFYQGLDESDISNQWYASIGTRKRIETFYKGVECYAYHVNYPLIMFLPLLLLVVAWFVCGMQHIYPPECLLILFLCLLVFAGIIWTDEKTCK